MSTSPAFDTVRLEARRLASDGAWPAVGALLAPLAADALDDGELALLYGEACLRTGDAREALAWLERLEPVIAAAPDRSAHRRAVNMLGVAAHAMGQLDEAARSCSRALELATQADDLLILAQASNNLGAIANVRGQHEVALWHYRIALPTLQRLGQPRRLAEAYHNMAITCRDLGELDEADEHERRAIEYAMDAGEPRLVAMGRVGRAEIALRRGDAPLAEMGASLAADELALLADPLNESDARRLVGASRAAQGLASEALVAFSQALAIAEQRGYALNRAEILRDRVEASLALGADHDARRDAAQALAIFGELGATAEIERLARRVATLGWAV